MRDNESTSVNWGYEIMHVLGIIGKILFRIFSYFMNILLTVLLIGLITGLIVGSVFAIYINNYLELEIDPTSIVTVNRDSTTRFYYVDYASEQDRQNRSGTLVEIEDQRMYAGENTLAVSYSELPEDLVNAFISIEDHRFRTHNGVDWIGTANATLGFITGGGRGGSTITQQLIKNVTGEDEVTIQRKVQEIFRALNLEKVKSKEEIIEAYMNIINLGNGCYGVQSAANYYFGKDVSELTLVECASFASIVKNPTQYNPKSHDKDYEYTKTDGTVIIKEGNETRRWVVLQEMMEQGYITEAECVAAQNEELKLVSHEEEETEEAEEGMTIYSWYTEAVITQLQKDLMEKYGVDRNVASSMIYNNGYKIVTAMDPEIQAILEEVYTNDSKYFLSTGVGLQPQSAMVIADPYTGDILGTVGGRGIKNLNRGTDRATVATRPPGSSIKPLSVYGPALDAGLITYGYAIDDSPVEFIAAAAGTDYNGNTIYSYTPYPKNLPEIYMGLTPIHDAITRSVNTVAMKVLQKLTIDRSFDFMKNELHFDSLIDRVETANGEVLTDRGLAALSLGQPNYGVTLLEMTAGYCMFQNRGMYNEPNLYLKVTDAEGKVVFDRTVGDPDLVISEASASIMTVMLQEVMTKGTGTSCTLQETIPVAGKTGTTSADFDRYFCGYTPYYVGCVWTGYDMPQSLSAFGENPSLHTWDTVMTMVHQKIIDEAANGGKPIENFELSADVIKVNYCKDSGMLFGDACSLDPRGWRQETGYFTRETAPTDVCTTHVKVLRDESTGLIASDGCYKANCKYTSLIRVEDRSFPIEVYVADAQYTYRELPPWTAPASWGTVPFYYYMLNGMYCGNSYPASGIPYNAYCYYHCDYSKWSWANPQDNRPAKPAEEEETVDDDKVADTEEQKPVEESSTAAEEQKTPAEQSTEEKQNAASGQQSAAPEQQQTQESQESTGDWDEWFFGD